MTTVSISRTILFTLSLCAMFGLQGQDTKKRSLLVLLGPPACGKGTLAEKYVKKKGAVTLSTGNLCREYMSKGTILGKVAKELSEGIVSDRVREWMEEQKGDSAVILDGFPRTGARADFLVNLLKDDAFKHFDLKLVRFIVSEQTVIDRIGGRMICKNKACQTIYGKKNPSKVAGVCDKCGKTLIKRVDDTQAVIKDRYKTYYDQEVELLVSFEKAGVKPKDVSAEQEIDAVFADFEKIIG